MNEFIKGMFEMDVAPPIEIESVADEIVVVYTMYLAYRTNKFARRLAWTAALAYGTGLNTEEEIERMVEQAGEVLVEILEHMNISPRFAAKFVRISKQYRDRESAFRDAREDEAGESCSVCTLSLEGTTVHDCKQCKLVTHSKCIKEWANINPTCPVCRVSLTTPLREEEEEEEEE